MPGPGDQSRPEAACWIQAGPRDGRCKPDHHRYQNPDHQWRPTHQTMTTHKKENGEHKQEGEAHFNQKDHPEGITCSWDRHSITYTGSLSLPDEYHQHCADNRTKKLSQYISAQVKRVHLPLRPECQRDGRIDMPTAELP